MGIGVKVHTGKVIHKWVREGGGALVLNIIYYILLNIFVIYRWEFTSVRVSPCCVLPSCAFLLYIKSCLSICMFYIDCTAEIKYIYIYIYI